MLRWGTLVVCVAAAFAAAPLQAEAVERLAAVTPAPVSAAPQPSTTIEDGIKALLADEHGFRVDKKLRAALTAYYAAHGYGAIWIDEGVWADRAKAIQARMEKARFDGLDPDAYREPSFAAVGPQASPDAIARADVDFSVASLTFARHLVGGRADIDRLAPLVYAKRPELDLEGALTALVRLPDPILFLDNLSPTEPGFLALKAELKRRIDAEPAPSTPIAHQPIPQGAIVRLGMADPRIPALRERFALETAAGQASDVMDGAVVAALRQFQQTRGLPVNGALTRATVKALNGDETMPDAHLSELLVNMERWRWLPRDLGQRYVMVNVPEYLVRIVDDGRVAYEGKVVVGAERTPTPLFSATMEYLVVNPSWTVPPGILKKEILPLYRTNPDAVRRMGLEPIETRHGLVFRQPPGERNALGHIKFMFPNDYSIYLHDTPSKGYFQRDKRAFSHGCVRVDTPLKFADVLLAAEPSLNARKLQAMFGSTERYVKLTHKIPVHLVYFTVEIAPDGTIRHHADVYGLDTKLREQLAL